ncbi:MAG: serine hydrolase domain-containing protein [Chloroflexota bacterium]
MTPQQLNQYIPQWMRQFDVKATSIVIIENHTVMYRSGFGSFNHKQINSDTLMNAQSLTKPMVAFRALQIVEAGLLDLDLPLQNYLKKPYSPDKRVDKITTRHALSHATGLPNWRDQNTDLILSFDAGTDYNYSGEGYCYLQTVMEVITGKPLEQLMQPLFEAVGMSDSFMETFTEEMREHWFFKDFAHLNTNAAFSLMTTADDYAKFMLTMLADDYQSIADVMLSPEQGVAAKDGFYWGNGWGIEDTPKGRYFWQWGAGTDERHLAIGNQETGWATVIMTTDNEGTDNGLAFAHKITQQYDADLGKWFDWLSE